MQTERGSETVVQKSEAEILLEHLEDALDQAQAALDADLNDAEEAAGILYNIDFLMDQTNIVSEVSFDTNARYKQIESALEVVMASGLRPHPLPHAGE